MSRKQPRFVPKFDAGTETLEARALLSTLGAGMPARTVTALQVSGGTLAQPITVQITVRAPASAGAPTGTVGLSERDNLLRIANLTPSPTSSNPRFAESTATVTLTAPPGGAAEFFGRHRLTAMFVPTGSFSRSSGGATLHVSQPNYTTLADGVKVATIAPGTGAALVSGQTASVYYTGYLAKNGTIFDDSLDHGGTPFSFTAGARQVIPGFDSGTVGMKVGESRIIEVPPDQGYGGTPNGSIPANSKLVFVVTLAAIS